MRLRSPRVLALCVIPFALGGCGGGSGLFSYLTNQPLITGISPSSVAPGATITISGANFDSTFTYATFTSGTNAQQTVQASSGSTTSVTVTVPSNLAAGTYNVTVYDNDGIDGQGQTSEPFTVAVT